MPGRSHPDVETLSVGQDGVAFSMSDGSRLEPSTAVPSSTAPVCIAHHASDAARFLAIASDATRNAQRNHGRVRGRR